MIFKLIEGVYLLERVSEDFYLNGKLIKRSTEPITVEEPTDAYYIRVKKELVSYNGLSEEDFNNKKESLDTRIFYDGRLIFSSIEEKKAYNRFLNKYQPTYQESEYKQPINIEVVKLGKSNSPYIKSLRMVGSLEPLFSYQTQWAFLFDEVGIPLGYTRGESNGNTYDVRTGRGRNNIPVLKSFSKLGNKYIPYSDIQGHKVTGTLEECNEKLTKDLEIVKKIFNWHKAFNYPLSVPTIGSQITELNKVLNRIRNIDYKVKSRDEYSFAITQVRDLIKELEKSISDDTTRTS